MALIKCPECGRERVSDSAVACPDCGYGIREHFEKLRAEAEESVGNEEKSSFEDSRTMQLIKQEEERIQRELEAEEARLKEFSEINENNQEQKQTEKELKTKILFSNEMKIHVDTQDLYAYDLLIPLGLIHRVVFDREIINYSVYVIGHDDKLIKKFKIAANSGNATFIKTLTNNVETYGGTVETVNFSENQLCTSCYHIIERSAMHCPICNAVTGAIFDQKENGYKCPNCGRNAGHPIKTGRKMISVGLFGGASNKLGKTYQCCNCDYMW